MACLMRAARRTPVCRWMTGRRGSLKFCTGLRDPFLGRRPPAGLECCKPLARNDSVLGLCRIAVF